MVFFATTRKGFDEYIALNVTAPLWLSASVSNGYEVRRLRDAGKNVTTFDYEINSSDAEVLADAIDTIREHHPRDSIWADVYSP